MSKCATITAFCVLFATIASECGSFGQSLSGSSLDVSGTATISTLTSGSATLDTLSVTGTATLQGGMSVTGTADFLGNYFCFGSWSDDPSTPGIGITYTDATSTTPSQLKWTATTSSHEWLWECCATDNASTVPMMKLDENHVLTIYDTAGNPNIVLSPGTPDCPNVVLTQQIADGLYVSRSDISVGWSCCPDVPMGGPSVSLNGGSAVNANCFAGINATANGWDCTAIAPGSIASNCQSVALGCNASALGGASVASGYAAVATGGQSVASAAFSTATGIVSVCSGPYGTASGEYAVCSGPYATASGGYSIASGPFSTASGHCSVAIGPSSRASGAGSVASAYCAIASDFSSVATGYFSTASGYESNASGHYATASGESSVASGYYGTVTGRYSVASGAFATADGPNSVASGYSSLAEGGSTVASGLYSKSAGAYSVAAGPFTTSAGYGQFVVGYNNIPQGDPDGWIPTDGLFIIGNGESIPSNAMVVNKNGDTTIYGKLTVDGGNAGLVVTGIVDATTDTVVASGPDQLVLIPQQGDLSMGAFKAGAKPITGTP